jgi:hypothetical protein
VVHRPNRVRPQPLRQRAKDGREPARLKEREEPRYRREEPRYRPPLRSSEPKFDSSAVRPKNLATDPEVETARDEGRQELERCARRITNLRRYSRRTRDAVTPIRRCRGRCSGRHEECRRSKKTWEKPVHLPLRVVRGTYSALPRWPKSPRRGSRRRLSCGRGRVSATGSRSIAMFSRVSASGGSPPSRPTTSPGSSPRCARASTLSSATTPGVFRVTSVDAFSGRLSGFSALRAGSSADWDGGRAHIL